MRGRLPVFLLLCLPATPFLPSPWSAAALAVLGLLWLRTVATPRERWVAALPLAAAAVALLVPAAVGPADRPAVLGDPGPLEEELADRYQDLWQSLEREAERAALVLGEPPVETGFDAFAGGSGATGGPLPPPGTAPGAATPRLDAFELLATLVVGGTAAPRERPTLFLIDPDGEAFAWAGEGLLNAPALGTLPREGREFTASFQSVTLMAVAPVEEESRPWRMVAGRSYPNDRWPFEPPASLAGRGVVWSLARPGTALAAGTMVVARSGLPDLVLRLAPAVDDSPWQRGGARIAWAALAALLLGVAVVRGLRPDWVKGGVGDVVSRREGLLAVASGGAVAAALAAGAGPGPVAVLAVGLGAAALAHRGLPARLRPTDWQPAAGLATVGVGLLATVAWGLHGVVGSLDDGLGLVDLGSDLLPGPGAIALRAGFGAAALAVLVAGRRRGEDGGGDAWAWGALGLLATAGAVHDWLAVALPLAIAGLTAGLVWTSDRRLFRPASLAVLALLATLLGAGVWESVHRSAVRWTMGEEALPRMAPLSPAEQDRLVAELALHFDARETSDIVPRSPRGLDSEDLAFAVWRGSPLARTNAFSTLVVEPRVGVPSSFSFGPPLDDPAADWYQTLLDLPVWSRRVIAGEAELTWGGNPWARVRYWLAPRPGFSLQSEPSPEAIRRGLLRERPLDERSPRGLPASAVYGLYDLERRTSIVSPWGEVSSLPLGLGVEGPTGTPGVERRPIVVETPSGPAWAWVRRSDAGWEALYLPVLAPGSALDRMGTHAVGNLLFIALGALAVLALALPRRAFRDLAARALRSYSQRLVIVLSLLAFVPLVLLNLFILSDAEERLDRDQRTAGEAALVSAQRVVGGYVTSLEPGFDFTTRLDDELLRGLSEVVHHEVNLYWRGSVWASSKRELFSAGLLPERIPGEIFSDLALTGLHAAARTNRTGEVEYLELYAPLRIPGVPLEEERFFLSLPLLAQQEEAAAALATLRRKAILVSTALFALLIAVGIVLARSFAEPIEQLVLGTRRIATGATSLELAPSELELAALVEAIDDMARRIAESRERLVREKSVVERMVDNITSGVVSVDHQRRVLMHNRVAGELLGVTVGERLDRAIERQERLGPVAEFLARVGRRSDRATVRLAPPVAPSAREAEEPATEREWSLVWVPVPGIGEPAALLVVEDATEVLRAERLEAWAEMARIIAHEIKNPLTPIRLSAEHMREVYGGGDRQAFERVFDRCTTNILHQVDELREIAIEFSAYSSIPAIDPQPGDLVVTLEALVEAYRSAAARGVRVELETAAGELPARFDERLLGRAVRNLIENALRASAGRAAEEGSADTEALVVVRLGAEEGGPAARPHAVISVLDSGPGVDPELVGRIFDPYFSTHDSGTGLGLPIARRVAEEHGGTISARNRPGGGLEVTIRIPRTRR